MWVGIKWRWIPLTVVIQQYSDVKDKLADLIPWLEKLLESLAKVNPDDDAEEVERRSQLAKFVPRSASLTYHNLTLSRSLEDIGTRSLALSEKGKVARVLDKTQDSQEVIRLVEKLRQAILIYQVSTGDLKRSGSVIIDLRDRCRNSSQSTTRSSN